MAEKIKPKIYVRLLNMGHVIAGLETELHKWMQEKSDKYVFNFDCRREVPTDSNRNHIVQEFLETDYDYLAMFDEDNFPLKNPFDLLEFDKDVIGGVYMGMGENGLRFHVYKAKNMYDIEKGDGEAGFIQFPPQERHGLMRVDAIGSGCIFIKRKVLEKLHAPFAYNYDSNGRLKMSDDIAFCHRCNMEGFEVWAHWDYLVEHYKTVPLLRIAGFIVRAAKIGIPRMSDLMKNE
jgi:hypothetical protein